ncbi:VOC family protein, partial [Acinetobacter baumannii]
MTLGVTDIAKARAFYEAIGFKASAASNDSIVFYDAGGVVLALFGRAALAKDANREDSASGFSGVTLAHNVGSEAEVEAALRRA